MQNNEAIKIIECAENNLSELYKHIDEVALINQQKVLNAFRNNSVAIRHFSGTNGYGYDDIGRDTLCKIYAEVFEAEKAIVSPYIVSGTHALTIALFGITRPGDEILSITGMPYDTLNEVIYGNGNGSLNDYNIKFEYIDMINNDIDIDKSIKYINANHPKYIYIQRSRGYNSRNALTLNYIEQICHKLKSIDNNINIIVDNCYGEFIEIHEPTYVGADMIIGSLIKNPGGGLAPTGGYIAGKEKLIELVEYRLTSPSIGMEVGSYALGYRLFYQGLFMAPHIVAQAVKGAFLFSEVMSSLGMKTLPQKNNQYGDIICSIEFDTENQLIKFCQTIQYVSPIDSYVTPMPWDMPGYQNQVIMAAGCFVAGSSIELSCDAPIKKPYIAYLQGGLTYEHCKLAALECVKKIF